MEWENKKNGKVLVFIYLPMYFFIFLLNDNLKVDSLLIYLYIYASSLHKIILQAQHNLWPNFSSSYFILVLFVACRFQLGLMKVGSWRATLTQARTMSWFLKGFGMLYTPGTRDHHSYPGRLVQLDQCLHKSCGYYHVAHYQCISVPPISDCLDITCSWVWSWYMYLLLMLPLA